MSRLLPRPRSQHVGVGAIEWRSPLRVRSAPEFLDDVRAFSRDIATSVAWEVALDEGGGAVDIEIVADEHVEDEGYRIEVADRVRIWSSTGSGVSYALGVLRQLGPDELWGRDGHLDTWPVPRGTIEDAPRFAWRGVHLDVARHFFDVATVLRFIDLLASHRLNRLHLHLNDDQGWRVEIPDWPMLTEVGSRRRSSPVGHESEGRDDGVIHEGFFSVEDLETMRRHAKGRHVVIVPEIDLPGHAQAAIASYPELGTIEDHLDVWTRWGISEHVLNVTPEALQFASDVVGHVADVFAESPVHVGGDECPTSEWEASETAMAAMDEHGFTHARQLQGLFTSRLTRELVSHGHEVLAWDEVLDAEVPSNVVIVAWRGVEKALEAARRGLDVIMAPMQWLYFDWLSSDEAEEPVAIAQPPAITTWQRVYSFSVIPEDLDADLTHHVRGAQAQLWTEYIATRDHLDYMAFPRLCAFSEVVWGTAGELDEFRERLKSHLGRLNAMGVTYRRLEE